MAQHARANHPKSGTRRNISTILQPKCQLEKFLALESHIFESDSLAWFDSASILESDSDDEFIRIRRDGFPLAGNPFGNISGGQVVQFERSARLADNGCKYEEYQSYTKMDGGHSDNFMGKDDELLAMRKNILDHFYGSLKGLREDRQDSNEKIQDNMLKSGLPRFFGFSLL
ncbi:hypothetical protein TB1_044414 [Malus domestica]